MQASTQTIVRSRQMPPRKKITEEAKAEEDPSLKNASTPDPDIPNDSGIQSISVSNAVGLEDGRGAHVLIP